jgi:hypothetical protein
VVLEVALPAVKFENPPKGLAPAAPLPKPDCPNFGVSVLGPLIAGIGADDPPNLNPVAAQVIQNQRGEKVTITYKM